MDFYRRAEGARFEVRGRQFRKVAMSMAKDAERNGSAFWSGIQVTPIGEPLLLAETAGELWKPNESNHGTVLLRPVTMTQHWRSFAPLRDGADF